MSLHIGLLEKKYKNGTPETITLIVLKEEQVWVYKEVMRLVTVSDLSTHVTDAPARLTRNPLESKDGCIIKM